MGNRTAVKNSQDAPNLDIIITKNSHKIEIHIYTILIAYYKVDK